MVIIGSEDHFVISYYKHQKKSARRVSAHQLIFSFFWWLLFGVEMAELDSSRTCSYFAIVVLAIGLLLMVILLPLSFSDVEYYQVMSSYKCF